MSVIDTLITDRTQADVDRVLALSKKGPNMTPAELAEYNGPLKGSYNYTDLNRVESAVDYIADALVQAPAALRQYASDRGVAWDPLFDVPYDPTDYAGITTKTDWVEEDIPTHLQMVRYLGNLKLIHDAIESGSIVSLPETMDRLTFATANGIEQMLKDVDRALTALIARNESMIRSALAVRYSGEIYSGEGEA